MALTATAPGRVALAVATAMAIALPAASRQGGPFKAIDIGVAAAPQQREKVVGIIDVGRLDWAFGGPAPN